MNLCDIPAYQLTNLIHRREVSAVEALSAVLERIATVDGRPGRLDAGAAQAEDAEKVHAFISLTAERARAQAREVDRQLAQGEDPGPLAGVPFTVKDIFTVKGTPSTAASRILAKEAS